jgi:hypothetical protein
LGGGEAFTIEQSKMASCPGLTSIVFFTFTVLSANGAVSTSTLKNFLASPSEFLAEQE